MPSVRIRAVSLVYIQYPQCPRSSDQRHSPASPAAEQIKLHRSNVLTKRETEQGVPDAAAVVVVNVVVGPGVSTTEVEVVIAVTGELVLIIVEVAVAILTQ